MRYRHCRQPAPRCIVSFVAILRRQMQSYNQGHAFGVEGDRALRRRTDWRFSSAYKRRSVVPSFGLVKWILFLETLFALCCQQLFYVCTYTALGSLVPILDHFSVPNRRVINNNHRHAFSALVHTVPKDQNPALQRLIRPCSSKFKVNALLLLPQVRLKAFISTAGNCGLRRLCQTNQLQLHTAFSASATSPVFRSSPQRFAQKWPPYNEAGRFQVTAFATNEGARYPTERPNEFRNLGDVSGRETHLESDGTAGSKYSAALKGLEMVEDMAQSNAADNDGALSESTAKQLHLDKRCFPRSASSRRAQTIRNDDADRESTEQSATSGDDSYGIQAPRRRGDWSRYRRNISDMFPPEKLTKFHKLVRGTGKKRSSKQDKLRRQYEYALGALAQLDSDDYYLSSTSESDSTSESSSGSSDDDVGFSRFTRARGFVPSKFRRKGTRNVLGGYSYPEGSSADSEDEAYRGDGGVGGGGVLVGGGVGKFADDIDDGETDDSSASSEVDGKAHSRKRHWYGEGRSRHATDEYEDSASDESSEGDGEQEEDEDGDEWIGDRLVTTGLKNYQVDIPIDKGLLERQIQVIKEIMGVQRTNVGIELLAEDQMQALNHEFLGKNKPTDILAFPYVDSPAVFNEFPMLRSLHNSIGTNDGDVDLGSIFMCPSYVQRRCDEDRLAMEESILNGTRVARNDSGISRLMSDYYTVQQRLPLLLIHGFLHLLKYDHKDRQDSEEMAAKEQEIAQTFLRHSREHRPSLSGHYVIGVGTDICHIPRITKLLESREERLLKHIFSPREQQRYGALKARYFDDVAANKQKKRSWIEIAGAYIAMRFATKEAVSKALGTGLSHEHGIRLQDIEVWSRPSGQPAVELLGKGRDFAQKIGVVDVMVAQTDEREYAVSFATACGSSSDIPPLEYHSITKPHVV